MADRGQEWKGQRLNKKRVLAVNWWSPFLIVLRFLQPALIYTVCFHILNISSQTEISCVVRGQFVTFRTEINIFLHYRVFILQS